MQPIDRSVQQAGIVGQNAAAGLWVVSIGKAFGARLVLRDLSLNVAHGEIVGLLGPDGAGKTTCFYSIIGLLAPDQGRIVLNGYDITHLPMYRRARLGLGYLPEEPSVFRGLTVAQNVRAMLEVYEPDAEALERKLAELLQAFHIDHLRDTPATRLSGGERRRCEIARAMAAEPSVMLLDEPFAGIDPLSIADVKATVLGLKSSGVGVLVTDYDLPDLFEIIDRAYVIYDGRILAHGPPEMLAEDESVRRLFLGQDFSLHGHPLMS
jgi:lipopolysaccharide export system ATP-binding protein